MSRKFILPALCFILLFCSSFFLFYKEDAAIKKSYEGKIILSTTFNNSVLFSYECTLYHDHLLEPLVKLNSYQTKNMDKSGKIVTDESKSRSFQSLMCYNLIDFKASTNTVFDTNEVVPVFKSISPLAQKKLGILVTENSEIKDYLNDFVFLKDTIMNNNSYKLLACNFTTVPARDKRIKKIILYVNTNLKEFPFHPISKTLDEKFGGLIDQSIMILDNGQFHGVQGIKFSYHDGLNKTEENKVLAFINEEKKHAVN